MNKLVKKILFCIAIAMGSVVATLLMGNVEFFKQLDLKAQDAHFVLRGKLPETATKDFRVIYVDDKTLKAVPDPTLFWQPLYGKAMRAVAAGGGKVMVIDHAFLINVEKYETTVDGKRTTRDADLSEAFTEVSAQMPVICAVVEIPKNQQDNPDFMVPMNKMAAFFGTFGSPKLTADSDDFIRLQELIARGDDNVWNSTLALRAAEKYLGKDVVVKTAKGEQDRLFLADHEIPVTADHQLTINYAGPPYTFPKVSLIDVLQAFDAGNTEKLKQWFGGKVVLLGDDSREDRRATPFYTAFTALSNKTTGVSAEDAPPPAYTTPGVEIHANVIRTLLSGEYLKPVPEWGRITALTVAASVCVAISVAFAVSHTLALATLALALLMVGTHLLFRQGLLLSTSQIGLSFAWALVGGIVYRFATAEKKSTFFKNAIGLFVGRQVATSLEHSEKISMTGKRQLVTILFTDIRGFTAFCESKDPAVVVDLLNIYMSTMVGLIVKYGGHVNKFIGDGILAVFCDDDPGAVPGDHVLRCTKCAAEIVVNEVCGFKTGAGYHVGEVIIGNVGSQDKLEFTVLGNTVNMASRLESLNKDQHSRLLMSEESNEMLHGEIDTIYMGAVPVKGKTDLMKLYSVTSLLDAERIADLNEKYPEMQAKNHEKAEQAKQAKQAKAAA